MRDLSLPLVDITARILISSFLHSVVPRGISGDTRARTYGRDICV